MPAEQWNLEAIEPPDGVSLFDHASALLPASGRGPLPRGGDPLPDEPEHEPGDLRFAPGFWDGVFGPKSDDQTVPAAAAALFDLLGSAPSRRGVDAVVTRLSCFEGSGDVGRLMNAVVAASPSRERAAILARWLCRHGTSRGTVKAGMALLAGAGNEDDVEIIMRLGLLEEMTLYAIVALQHLLDDPECAIFDLAQQVEGWGRVHAVRRLRDTQNAEIKRWLLYGGYENNVMFEETAFIAATVGGLRQALETTENEELLDHAGTLLVALAMGGPAEDMSDYPDAAPVLSMYLERTARAAPSIRRLNSLSDIEAYLAEDTRENPHIDADERARLQTMAKRALERPEWASMIRRMLDSDDRREVADAARFARRFGIDERPVLWRWLRREPIEEGSFWGRLGRGASLEELRELADAAVELPPLDELANGPGEDLGLGLKYEADNCLGVVLQELRRAPGVGWPVIATGLRNRVVRNRNQAIAALEAWPAELRTEEVQDVLQEAFWKEPRADVRASIRALIENERPPD